MSRSTGREKVNFAIAPEMLALADLQADAVGLDRYDVLRLAIGKGLLQMRLEHELQRDAGGAYTQAMLALVRDGNGPDTAAHLETVGKTLVGNVEQDAKKLKQKQAKK